MQHVQALGVSSIGPHKKKVLSNCAGEQLSVLRDESDLRPQLIWVDLRRIQSVVANDTLLRLVQTH